MQFPPRVIDGHSLLWRMSIRCEKNSKFLDRSLCRSLGASAAPMSASLPKVDIKCAGSAKLHLVACRIS
jgi:hypothetical protein